MSEPKIPKATHDGSLQIGELTIPCAVLEDGTRVLSERGTTAALGKARGSQRRAPGDRLPEFVSAKNLAPYISDELRQTLSTPIRYTATHGGRPAYGFKAEVLPQICDVWLKARDAGPKYLTEQQRQIAERADILIRGLAHVGVIALVDEATGYQEERNRTELQQILAAYISKELMPWTKRFPDSFYEEMFRLRGWQYNPVSVARPKYVAKLTSDLVYEKLPPGVVEELRRKNPRDPETGRRPHKHHQHLTEDIGNSHLERHLAAVIALMRAAPNWGTFKRMFTRAFPPPQTQIEIPEDGAEDENGTE